jgi:hypothetical protein
MTPDQPIETSEADARPYAPPRPRLIGLTGRARSGKDTAADYLVRRYGFVKHSFAAPIREFVARIAGMTLSELEQTKELPLHWLNGVTPRHLMQTVGTEWGRDSVDQALWIKSCFARASRDLAAGRSVVICDVRFDNEAEELRRLDGQVWAITREGSGTTTAHSSEAGVALGLTRLTLVNSGPVEGLYALLDGAILS